MSVGLVLMALLAVGQEDQVSRLFSGAMLVIALTWVVPRLVGGIEGVDLTAYGADLAGAPSLVGFLVLGGTQDHGYVLGGFVAGDSAARLEAIHPRHHDVHHHEIVDIDEPVVGAVVERGRVRAGPHDGGERRPVGAVASKGVLDERLKLRLVHPGLQRR